MHHIMVALHPRGEPPLDPSEPFFRTYMGGPEDRAAYLAALERGEEPTVPAVLHAQRACVRSPYDAVDLSAAAACMASELQTAVFKGVPPRAVALIPALVDVEAHQQSALPHARIISDKICIERIPDIAGPKGGLKNDPGSVIFDLYVLHAPPSSIPP